MMEVKGLRRKLFSVSIKDCDVQTFTVGGHGGAGKDTSNTGVRIVHRASGATGEARDTRSQVKNKRLAFTRMAQTKTFKMWVRVKAAELKTGKTIDELVDEDMTPDKLKVEVREGDKWVDEKSQSCRVLLYRNSVAASTKTKRKSQ